MKDVVWSVGRGGVCRSAVWEEMPEQDEAIECLYQKGDCGVFALCFP